jgi:hypothetical protein
MIYSKKCKDIGAQLLRKIEINIAIALFIKKIHTIKYKEQKCSYQKDAM